MLITSTVRMHLLIYLKISILCGLIRNDTIVVCGFPACIIATRVADS